MRASRQLRREVLLLGGVGRMARGTDVQAVYRDVYKPSLNKRTDERPDLLPNITNTPVAQW